MLGRRPPDVPDLPSSIMKPSSMSSPMSFVTVGTLVLICSLRAAMLYSPLWMQSLRMVFFRMEFLLSFLSRKVVLIVFRVRYAKIKQIFRNKNIVLKIP